MATSGKKPSAAQMAARRLFAERAKAGVFGGVAAKAGKRATKKNPLYGAHLQLEDIPHSRDEWSPRFEDFVYRIAPRSDGPKNERDTLFLWRKEFNDVFYGGYQIKRAVLNSAIGREWLSHAVGYKVLGPMTIGPDFVVTQNPKRRVKRNPVDFQGGSVSTDKASVAKLRHMLEQLRKALDLPEWGYSQTGEHHGAIGFDKNMQGWQLVQLVKTGGEQDLSARLSTAAMQQFLAGALLIAKAQKT